MRPKSVLFLCVYNACRSRIGQAVARRDAPPFWTIDSAGLTPGAGVDQKAAAVLRRHGLTISADKLKIPFPHPSGLWDCVVDISCTGEGSKIPARRHARWDIPDPMGGPPDVYEALYADIDARVRALLEELEREP